MLDLLHFGHRLPDFRQQGAAPGVRFGGKLNKILGDAGLARRLLYTR